MKRIGLLSDTHGYWDDRYTKYFSECDEIWHAGDFGSSEIADRLSALKPLRGVFGNIDGHDLRMRFSEKYRFKCEEVEVLMKHIGGYPGHYDPSIRGSIFARPPKLFISGHSHILKVVYDKTLGCLHINPGAAGISGFHKVRTLVRFTIDGTEIKDLEVIELGEKRNC
ncbi:MAG: metallophosphoesterase family protein [Bacteroidaceae bacterium]|nr:metallophosphoesterase family protein [Bacteroidaceae bacterium]